MLRVSYKWTEFSSILSGKSTVFWWSEQIIKQAVGYHKSHTNTRLVSGSLREALLPFVSTDSSLLCTGEKCYPHTAEYHRLSAVTEDLIGAQK